jgi:hypothetical protein
VESQPRRGPDLFTEVVEASGLSSIFGPGTIRRALRDVGSAPARADVTAYRRALPAIEARLAAFMPPADGALAIQRIKRVLAASGRRG